MINLNELSHSSAVSGRYYPTDESLVILREAEFLIKIIHTQRDREKTEKYMKAHSIVRNEDKVAGALSSHVSHDSPVLSERQGKLSFLFLVSGLLTHLYIISDLYVA